jgi:tetratricopeptide (TPR) repeat protein
MRIKTCVVFSVLLFVTALAGAQVINRGVVPSPHAAPRPAVTGARHRGAYWYYERAERYALERRWELARRELRRALELDANYLEAVLLLGRIYRESGELTLALEQYEWAIRRGGNEAQLRVLMGEIHLARGDVLHALEQYIVLRDLGSPGASDLWWRIEGYVRERK